MTDPIDPPKFTTIDAEPHEVRSPMTRRAGRFNLAVSIAGIILLSWVWWHRNEVSADALFWVMVIFGMPTGGFLMAWLNQWRGV